MKSTFSVSRPGGCEHRFAVDFTHGQTLSLIFKAVQYSLCSAVDRFSPSEDEGRFPDLVEIEISRPAESLLILRASFKTGAMPNYSRYTTSTPIPAKWIKLQNEGEKYIRNQTITGLSLFQIYARR